MIFTENSITLLKRNLRENDKIISVYTQNRGRLTVRFTGVNKPKAKLRAFCEPFVHSDLRLYLKEGAYCASATGGKLITVFPQIRSDYKKTLMAFYFCELVYRMTAEMQPNPEKYNLLLEALTCLENSEPDLSLKTSFMLKLMTLSGHGVDKPVLGIDKDFWDTIHNAPLEQLNFSAVDDLHNLNKADYVARRFLLNQLGKLPLTYQQTC